jgi:hypothetical protein
MLLSEWRKTAPNRECMSNKVLSVLKPVLADLGADGDPACWIIWGEDPEFRYSIMVPTPAGLLTVAIRISGGEGPRVTAKLVRWGKLQLTELSVEASGGHRLVAVQVEGQVLKGMDKEADRICEFVLWLLAGIDGRAFEAAGPILVQTVPQVAASPRAAFVPPPAPKVADRRALKAVPAPVAAVSKAAREAANEAAAASVAAGQPPARKPAKTPGGKAQAAWVAPHPIGLPAPRTQTPAGKPPAPQLPALKPGPKAPAAHPAAAARSAEPVEGGPVWEVPEPSESLERDAKRPRTWIP